MKTFLELVLILFLIFQFLFIIFNKHIFLKTSELSKCWNDYVKLCTTNTKNILIRHLM